MMRASWMKKIVLLIVVLMGVFWIENKVYADEPVMVNYFNIDIKATTTTVIPNCSIEFGVGDGNMGTQEVCGEPTYEYSTADYKVEVSSQDGHALVNDAFVANAGDIKFSISTNGDNGNEMTVTAGEDVMASGIVTKDEDLAVIRGKLEGRLRTKTVSHIGNVKEIKYEFSIGGIESREKKVYGSQNPDGTQATCMSAAGTSLGWILCPALEAVNGATGWAYDSLLKPALQVDPQLFTQESVNPNTNQTGATTRQAWDTFRNIANILFIILLLVVIISQLTGYGIDNYGIKKILPKLIVAAILINLSYWICVAVVDLSNILGNSLQSMLASLPPANDQLPNTVGDVNLGSIAGGAVTFVAVLGVLAGSVGVGIMAAGGGVAFLISILVAAISAIVSIFFLFLLLAAREAAIVVLVVLSPLAFACNILPNTQDLFKKWWQLGWKLLLVYPIAGLLLGGGDFVSRLLLLSGAGSSGFFSAFAAVIVGIVPIFFIPTVLKNSFAAMGNLGAKISGIGQKVGGRLSSNTDKAIRGSERFKNYQSDRDRQRKIESARRTAARYEGRNLDPNSRQARAYTQAQSILLGEEAENQKRANLLNGGFAAAQAGIEARADDDMVKNMESMLSYGKLGVNGEAASDTNPAVNVNDLGAMKSFHAAALADYQNATSDSERSMALSRIKAAQNIMSKSDAGRGMVQSNFQDAVNSGNTAGLQAAASHIMGQHGETYKSKNRGAHAMMQDLASGASINDVATKVNDGTYEKVGTDKYTAESLANADEAAINNLIGQLNNMDPTQLGNIQATAYEALHNDNITLKPEVESKLKQLAGNYVPAQTAQIRSSGAYQHQNGNVVQLHEMSDGTFVDAQSGQTVDIRHYKKR